MDLVITIPGKPQPKERPRRMQAKNGKVIWYTPTATQRYERHVKNVALAARQAWVAENGREWPLTAEYAVELDITFRDRRVADIDNVLKACLDGAEGVLWRSDRQVIDQHPRRTPPHKLNEGVVMVVRLREEPFARHSTFLDPTEPL